MDQTIECDVAIIGGGLGGVAAALAAADAGLTVVLTESTDWIGGQVTSQAVSALDEHHYIESFGGTRTYYQFREGVRAAYRERYGGPREMPDGRPLNPGNGWVSGLCFEPRVGLSVLEGMVSLAVASHRWSILLNHTPVSAVVRGGRIRSVRLKGPEDARVSLRAAYFLDATELGDLLPLTGAPYVSGAEAAADTGEPHACADGPQPERVQSFTTCFLVEYRAGENHTIRKPIGYETWREKQPFTFTLRASDGSPRRFCMFTGDLPFWTYRRALDASLFRGAGPGRAPLFDVALINWDSNDYYKESLIDRSPAQKARILKESRRMSLSFLYWLQTEAPRDSGRGYPGLRLLPEAVGTADGLAKAPYIRESRRLLGYKRVLEQDISERPGLQARALHYPDTVGVGWYPIDLHRCAGDPARGKETRVSYPPSLPFQIPLGALLSPALENLVAAAKNIATTHITNGAYRLHPVEWNTGEAAGMLAAYCLAHDCRPAQVLERPLELRRFQAELLAREMPLFWGVDLFPDDPDFGLIQAALVQNPPPVDSPRGKSLQILPDEPITLFEAGWLFAGHPRARESPRFEKLLRRWQKTPDAPFTTAEYHAGLYSLDLTSHAGGYPTLREVCRKLR